MARNHWYCEISSKFLTVKGFDQVDVNASTVYLNKVFLPVTCQSIFSNPNGKFGTDINSGILMEYEGSQKFRRKFIYLDFLPFVISNLNPYFDGDQISSISNVNLYDYADEMLVNLPPPRIDAYVSRFQKSNGQKNNK